MKRKFEDNNYFDEIYDEIVNNINITSIYLEKTKYKYINESDIFTYINGVKKIYDNYLKKLNDEIIYKIKNEIDLFFYLLAIKNNNCNILLKLILKIDKNLLSLYNKK